MIFSWFRKKTKIADLSAGQVWTIKGVISASSQMKLPQSGTPCVYYTVMEERFGRGERGTGRSLWFPDKMAQNCIEFSVSDDTGEVVIRESGERLSVSGAHQESGPVKGKKKRRYSATYLNSGDVVIVRGIVDGSPRDQLLMNAPPGSTLRVKVVRQSARPRD
jgi:hypothetical protein